VGSAPVTYVDPSGLWCQATTGAVLKILGGLTTFEAALFLLEIAVLADAPILGVVGVAILGYYAADQIATGLTDLLLGGSSETFTRQYLGPDVETGLDVAVTFLGLAKLGTRGVTLLQARTVATAGKSLLGGRALAEEGESLLGSRAFAAEARALKAPTKFKPGSFSVRDWSGYPRGVPKPSGPFRLLEGAEYDAARKAANKANAALRRAKPANYAGKHIHEIHPVKFGGSPIDPANKIALKPGKHFPLTDWWKSLQSSLER